MILFMSATLWRHLRICILLVSWVLMAPNCGVIAYTFHLCLQKWRKGRENNQWPGERDLTRQLRRKERKKPSLGGDNTQSPAASVELKGIMLKDVERNR